jgi:hypothetical protein
MGENVDETIDHNLANLEYKTIIRQNRIKNLQKFIIDSINNQNKIKSTKPRTIVRKAFLNNFK